MDFPDALKELFKGGKVRRAGWVGYLQVDRNNNSDERMNRPYIYAVCAGGEVVPAVMNNLDMFADDWMVVV